MIKSIHIRGFRGIPSLKIDDFKKINLFLGQNNCGKTSILEALFLIIGISNPNLSYNLNKFRGLIQTESDDFRFIFNKFDFDINLRIAAGFSSGQHRILTIKPHLASGSAVNYDGPQKLDRVLSVIFCVLNFILCNISQFNAIEIFRVRSFSPNALMPSLGIV